VRLDQLPSIAGLDPATVRQFLRSRGWVYQRETLPGVHEYAIERAERRWLIDVPTLDYGDFARRMAELVELLAQVHSVPVLTLLDDLASPPGDVLELAVVSAAVRDGTVPLADAVRIRQAQRDLILSAAHATLEPRPYFPRMSRREAVELTERCREGQTARGSYRTRLIIPVDPQVGQSDIEPFGRRVALTLVGAVDHAVQAVGTDRMADLLTSHERGVSANLLQSLAQLAPPGDDGYTELSLRWSPTRPAPASTPRMRIEPWVFPYFRDAARSLRASSPEAGHCLEGYVVRLAREPDAEAGQIVVLESTEDEGVRKVQVNLGRESYGLAVEAHRTGGRVRIYGTLRRGRRTLELEGAYEVGLMSEGVGGEFTYAP
jgi:hypothetical protein